MEDKTEPMTHSHALRRLLTFARGHWRIAAWQFTLALAGTSLIFVFPGVVRWFMDEIMPQKCSDLIWRAGGLALLAFTLREALFYVRTRVNCTSAPLSLIRSTARHHGGLETLRRTKQLCWLPTENEAFTCWVVPSSEKTDSVTPAVLQPPLRD